MLKVQSKKNKEIKKNPWLKHTSGHILLTENSRAAACCHLSLSLLWQKQGTLWCQLCRGSPSNVKFVCLRLSGMSLSPFVLYHITPSPLKPLPALFIDPKATCVYLVYYYAPNSSRRMLSDSSKGRFTVFGPCSASFSSPLTFWCGVSWPWRIWRGRLFIPPVLTARYDCRTDPAKCTPHYPNETLAWDASSLARHRLPHKVSVVLCCARGSAEGGLLLILHKWGRWGESSVQ